jgi:hypothetical protein
MTTTPTRTLDLRAEQLRSLAAGDDYAWIATAHRVTSTQAMVAFNRGDTIILSEVSEPERAVHALTTLNHRDTTTWTDLYTFARSSAHPRTFYVVVPEQDADGNAWPLAYTQNRIRIVPGLKVRDYNYRETTVTDRTPSLDGPLGTVRTPWFTTENGGLFDGSRLFAL